MNSFYFVHIENNYTPKDSAKKRRTQKTRKHGGQVGVAYLSAIYLADAPVISRQE